MHDDLPHWWVQKQRLPEACLNVHLRGVGRDQRDNTDANQTNATQWLQCTPAEGGGGRWTEKKLQALGKSWGRARWGG